MRIIFAVLALALTACATTKSGNEIVISGDSVANATDVYAACVTDASNDDVSRDRCRCFLLNTSDTTQGTITAVRQSPNPKQWIKEHPASIAAAKADSDRASLTCGLGQ